MTKSKAATKKATFPGQHEGETVELVFHQHPLVMRKVLIIGLLVVLVSVLPPLFRPLDSWVWKPLMFALLFLVVYWFHAWMGWFYTVYVMTDERLIEIKQRGFFNRKVSEYGLDKIQNINYHISGFQAVLFQYGDIVAQTYVGDIIMKTIHKPVAIHSQMIEVVRRVNASTPSPD